MGNRFSRRSFLRVSLAATAGAVVARPGEASSGQVTGTGPASDSGAWAPAVQVQATVNGQAHLCTVTPDESALELVRDRLGLTGAKHVCGHGACGACAVRVNGQPVAACLLPAAALHGAEVQTVEGLGPELHPVQRAFMAEDALQCGYCTPGFVVESVAFFERWRAEHGALEPSRERVAEALAGHLCRCGAYENIYRAVAGACAGRFDQGEVVAARVDAEEKVTGSARYTTDVKLDGMLEGRVLRAWRAPAKLVRLDVERARSMPGVRAVYVFAAAGSTLRYAGQEIVAVAATDRKTAEAALASVEASLEYSAPVIGLDAARKADAPRVYQEKADGKTAPSANEGPVFGAKWEANTRGPTTSHFFSTPGKAVLELRDLAASGKGTLVEGTWKTQTQCHSSLEPHAAVAVWEGRDRLTVHLSTQACHATAEDIADRWGLSPDRVRVLAPYVGGGFGAKAVMDNTAVAAIELARAAGAPVRVVLDRAEELAVGGNRPAHEIHLTLGVDEAGEMVGLRCTSWADGGVAIGNNANLLLRIIYPHSNKELIDYDVVTHAPPAKPFRGPGGPPGLWALEQAVDELALRRGEDPITVRRRLDPNPIRGRLYDQVEKLAIWRDRGPAGGDKGRYRRGVGLANAVWPYMLEPPTQVSLQADPDGRIVAATACQDMGQGSRTVLARAVAEVLGVPEGSIELQFGDSALPRGPMSGGSRTTASIAVAAEDAAVQLREALVEAARDQGLRDARAAAGGVEHAGGFASWADVLKGSARLQTTGRRRRDEGGYFLPIRVQGLALGKGLGVGVLVVELEVDTQLGRVRPRTVWAGFGIGRRVVPALADSQARGGIFQGLSYALYEDRRLDPRHATLLTAGLEDYRILGIGDAPEIELYWDEEGFEHTRARGIGLGELVTVGVAAAVGNAVHHATGWRPYDLPLRPDIVLEGVRA